MMRKKITGLIFLCVFLMSGHTHAHDGLQVAAAANLNQVLPVIVKSFASDHPEISVRLSFAATATLYAQIIQGAPFDLFLSADQKHPELLSQSALTTGKPFYYSSGQLVLWVEGDVEISEGLKVLLSGDIRKIAMANQQHAPYGIAAREVLFRSGLLPKIQNKLVFAENVAQVGHFVYSGAAQAGFATAAQFESGRYQNGSLYVVPQDLYTKIDQYGVLLKRADKNLNAAKIFRDYLLSEKGRKIFRTYHYQVP